MKKMRKRNKVILTVVLVLSILGGIVYKLADRYLIEHVQVVVESNPSTAAGEGTSESQDSTSQGSTSQESAVQATSDDWNYESDTQKISIEKVQTGSGDDTITYYVADVVLKDASSLLTAFAKDSFGTNITQNTSTIAENHNAIFAINGDYYGFRDTGVVIRNGELYRDEPARDGFATLSDGTMMSYDETKVSSSELLAQGVTNTFSFGPILVANGEVAGDFSKVSIDKNFGNRSIQNANPRTGIGVIAPNHYVFVVVDGRSSGYSRGMTLDEFAQLFVDLGATDAYNLDGGGSSTMYFNGRVVNDPLGKGDERGVSDIIYLTE